MKKLIFIAMWTFIAFLFVVGALFFYAGNMLKVNDKEQEIKYITKQVEQNNELGTALRVFNISQGGTATSTTPSDNSILLGNSTDGVYNVKVLTAGSGITFTETGNALTITAGAGTTGNTVFELFNNVGIRATTTGKSLFVRGTYTSTSSQDLLEVAGRADIYHLLTLGYFSATNTVSTSTIAYGLDITNGGLDINLPSCNVVGSDSNGALFCQSAASATTTLTGGVSVGSGGLATSKGLSITGGVLVDSASGTSTFTGGISANTFTSTKGITVSGSGTSTYTGGIFANAFRFNQASCTSALETDSDGSIICGTDADTTYTAAANLTLSGTAFSVKSTLYSLTDVFATSTGSVYASSTLQVTGNLFQWGLTATSSTQGALILGTDLVSTSTNHMFKLTGGSIVTQEALGTTTINAASSDWFTTTLSVATTTVIIQNFTKGDCIVVEFRQDTTGKRKIQFDNDITYIFDSGATSTIAINNNTAGPSDVNVIRFCQMSGFVGAQDGPLYRR